MTDSRGEDLPQAVLGFPQWGSNQKRVRRSASPERGSKINSQTFGKQFSHVSRQRP